MQQSTSLASAARVIAPEVTMITFRYFDGTQWLPSWDSSYHAGAAAGRRMHDHRPRAECNRLRPVAGSGLTSSDPPVSPCRCHFDDGPAGADRRIDHNPPTGTTP